MELSQVVDELRRNYKEIRKQNRFLCLRKILKVVLIGFLIGKDCNVKITKLEMRNKKIINEIFSHFYKGISDKEKSIKLFSNTYASLVQFEERIKLFEKEIASTKSLLLYTEEMLRKYHEMLISHVKSIIETNEKIIIKKVEETLTSGTYLIHNDKQNCLKTLEAFQEDLSCCDQSEILEKEYINEKKNTIEKFKREVAEYNKNFANQRKREYIFLWQKGLLSLDDEQQTAIVTDDKYNIVVAAAGSGKTEVLITRIAYLKMRKPDSVKPNRILAIAYQNKDVKEIEKRLKQEYDIIGVNVKTFHSLGIEVLKRAGRMRKILDKNDRLDIVKSIYKNKIQSDPYFYQSFLNYIKSLHEPFVKEDEIADKIKTLRVKRTLPYTSINNKKVQSRAEKEILDFLLTSKLNGKPIEVKYEPEIENLGKPDFYLPEYNLFIENWGLNKNGEVPEWFSQTTTEYLQNMERKKQWFADNNKLLVETFTYEYDENNPRFFIDLLKSRIIQKLEEKTDTKFHFDMMTYKELIEIVSESDRDWISEDHMSIDILGFIKNAKTYDLRPERILEKLESGKWSHKQRAFGTLGVEVYRTYQDKLRELHKIDFEDMINDAIHELNQNEELCKNIYDHILVDEYQDITQQTHKLVKKILSHNPTCKLFCVGDDWQSIMGFAGSNLEFFVNFEKHYDNPAITRISTNYRSIGRIVDAGACLIRNNQSCQIHKTTVSKRKEGALIKILKSPHQFSYRKNYYKQIAEDCMNRVAEYLKKGYANKDILILSRFMMTHSYQAPRFHFIIENLLEEAKNRGIKISPSPKTEKQVRVLTVHKAKGLQAKVVFILNVIKDVYGFPSEIENSSILEPARENYPLQDPKEEERRLFYVAMTRAMEELYIYTWEPAISEFVDEIVDYAVEERLNY